MRVTGKCSWFGGPSDTSGMSADEPLAFIYETTDAPLLFLPGAQVAPALGRELNPDMPFVACRWDYDDPEQTRDMLLSNVALIRALKNGRCALAAPADWGPGSQTGRTCDLSYSLMERLDLETDDEVEVIFPVMSKPALEKIITVSVPEGVKVDVITRAPFVARQPTKKGET